MKYLFFVYFTLMLVVWLIFLANLLVVYPTAALLIMGCITGIQVGTWFYKGLDYLLNKYTT